MSAGRGHTNTPGNRPLFLSAGVPNSDCHNLAAPAVAGNITSQVLFSPCSMSVPNTIQEVSAPQSAQLSPRKHTTEQNVPCRQMPLNIIVFHRQLIGRGSRVVQLPLSALPDVSEERSRDSPSGENATPEDATMSAGRGHPNTPGMSAWVPNSGCHNLAAPAAGGNTGSITSQVLFSLCSTSVPNTIQEISASAELSPISHATEQEESSWNVPCTQVPLNIIVFHRQLTGRGWRVQLPLSVTTALPDVSDGSGRNRDSPSGENPTPEDAAMSAGRGDLNTRGNRPLFLSAGVPNSGCHNLVAPAAAGNTGSITSQVPNTIQEVSAQQSAQLSLISCAAEQEEPSWNVPCTQVSLNIIVFHRQLTGRGWRVQLPLSATTALPDVSEGASTRLAGSNFLSLGRTSSIVAGDMTMNSSQLATPDKYNSEHLRLNRLYDEASKTENGIETSQLPQLATTIFRDSYNDLESLIPAATRETRVQHSQESTTLLAESTTNENIHMYQSMQKRLKTQINQSERTPLSTPTVPKEKTLTQIEMQIASAEKTKKFSNEETRPLKMKARKRGHRPKVIRENKLAKVQKPDSTPDGKSPNQEVKRSCARKKKILSFLENCSCPVSDQSISRATGVAARSRTAEPDGTDVEKERWWQHSRPC